jgi:tetratricopeptide (TPR) repeat protein
VLLNGPGIATGARISGADIYDVTPTVLHLLGLPVAQDMKGRVLESALTPEYRQEHPVESVATSETGPWDRGDEIVVDQQAGRNMEEMLRSLGYIGGGENSGGDGTAAPNVEQSINLAVVLRNQARYDEAVDLLEKVLETNPDSPEARFNLANTYAEMGRIEDAAGLYAQLVDEQPDDPRNSENLALAYGRLGRPADALRVYDNALQAHPDWASAMAGRGFTLHELGRDEEALESLDRAIEMDPRAADAWYYRGATLADLGRLADAREDLQRALQLDPMHDPAQRRLSRVLVTMGDRRGAESVLQGSGASAGPGAKAQLGSMALQEGRVDEALPLLQEAAPALNDPEIWGNLGMAYAMSGDLPHGAEAFERVIALRPEMQDARAQLAAFYAQLGRIDKAATLMEQVLEAEPENGRYHLQLGVIFAMQGKRDQARREIDRALELDPTLPVPPGLE